MSIILYSVMTLDGKIAHDDRDSLSWTSSEDKNFLRRELERFELALVGRSTYDISRQFYQDKTTVVFSRGVEELTEHHSKLFYSPLESFNPQEMCRRAGVKDAVLLGGSYIYSYFLQQGWVDELYLTVEPLIFGQGVSWLSPREIKEVHRGYQLKEVKQFNEQGTLLLTYQRAQG